MGADHVACAGESVGACDLTVRGTGDVSESDNAAPECHGERHEARRSRSSEPVHLAACIAP